MDVFTEVAAQRAWSREHRRAGRSIAFVPTMGALHEGHASLIRLAREKADVVVASIFVNPIQFDNPEDLDGYAEPIEADLALCRREGVAAVFRPQRQAMYPDGYATFVEVVGPLTAGLCGATRPGHFRGVATVVSRLFHVVEPDVAVFGEKDLQQVLVVQRMVSDLLLPVQIVVGPTVRERDGLAMSSRNARLTPAARDKALALPTGLDAANRAFKDGERSSLKLIEHLANELLVHPDVDLDYADVVRAPYLEEVDTAQAGDVLAAATFVDGVRLIDHVLLGGPDLL